MQVYLTRSHDQKRGEKTMSQLVDKAFLEVSKLPPLEQDLLANQILDEIATEKRWMDTFNDSQDILADLAEEALTEHRSGKTQDMDAVDRDLKNN